MEKNIDREKEIIDENLLREIAENEENIRKYNEYIIKGKITKSDIQRYINKKMTPFVMVRKLIEEAESDRL